MIIISERFLKCFRDKPALDNNGNIGDFVDNSATDSFNFKEKITSETTE